MAMTQSFSRCPPPSTFLPSPALTSSSSSSCSPHRHGPRRRPPTAASSLHLGPEDIAELARNKVLIAATVASAIGQLSKPFTSGKDGGGGVDIVRAAVRSGGMPSTHSAAVVAVTMSLGLERGFADSIFGMSVVFAAIVMYDAQHFQKQINVFSGTDNALCSMMPGVRREVGNHARRLNKLWILREQTVQNQEDDALVNSTSELLPANHEMASELVSVTDNVTSSQRSNAIPYSRHSSGTKSSRPNALRSSEPEPTELTEQKQAHTEEFNQLSESVGHTGLQVAVGALLGFVVSLAVYATP